MKAAILGVGSSVPNSKLLSNTKALDLCGGNTGNLLFQHAIRKIISPRFDSVVYPDLLDDATSIIEMNNADVVIIPCADFITQEYSLDALWERIKYNNKPCIPIGLGVGGSFNGDIKTVSQSTLNVLNYFKTNAIVTYARGDYTLSLLSKLGFNLNDVVNSGCFSNFLGDENTLRISYSKLRSDILQGKTPRYILSGDKVWNPDNCRLERTLYKFFRLTSESSYLIQSHIPLIDLCRPDSSDESFYTLSRYAWDLLQAVNPEGRLIDLIDDIESRYGLFFDINEWSDWTKLHDISVGMRLHGNMIAMQNGLITLWISHDIRTRELAKQMELPSISAHTLENSHPDPKLLSECFHDQIEKYFSRRRSLRELVEQTLNDKLSKL